MLKEEVHLFCDGTFHLVQDVLSKRLQQHQMTFILMDEIEVVLVEEFVDAIEDIINYRNQVRMIELMFCHRQQFPPSSYI